MSGLDDVAAAACRIVAPSGALAGTGFAVLEGGWVLTCHHVVRGLPALAVQGRDDPGPVPAEYDAERSVPEADVAVLRAPGLSAAPVQLGALRTGVDATGVGFRPSELDAEPHGRRFTGRLTAGQELRLPPPALPAEMAALAEEERPPWMRGPPEYHAGEVANLAVAGGLEQGVSGGPVYDPGARRVVGLFRAIEGTEQAYVLPLELLRTGWPDLLERNREEVADSALDALADAYGIGLVREGARRHRPQPWRDFEPLFDAHARFGGRAEELARLDRSAAGPGPGGYALVTAPSGYGKTALLATWVHRLRAAGRPVALHFISPRLDDALSARDVLGSLCRQLLALHDLGGELPPHDTDLRHLLSDLLGLPPAAGDIVVVVDGLDETLGAWRPEGLFPARLPAGMHVVLSARTVADTDWVRELKLPPDVEVLALDRLGPAEVAELVRDVGGDEATAAQVTELTDGDPFFVHDVLEDLAAGDAGALERGDGGHSAYLRAWWVEARERNPGPGFVDLMGTLAVLRAPLGRVELARLADDDALTGADLPVLVAAARRYLDGDDAQGYRLAHRRIEELIRATLADELPGYRRRLSAFCTRAPDAAAGPRERRYQLRHAASHLLDEDRLDDAYALLSEEWLARHFLDTGSYRLLIEQAGEIAAALADGGPADATRVAGLLVLRETARAAIADLPPDVLVAWTRLGGGEQVVEACGALGPYRGEAARPLIAVAGALLELEDPPSAAAAELLGRAIGMLPLVRTALWTLERLDELAPVLRHPALAPAVRADLIDQLAAVAGSVEADSRRALVLAHAAAAAATAGLRERAADLLDAARAAVDPGEPAGDASLVEAILLPAAEPAAIRDGMLAAARGDLPTSLEADPFGRWAAAAVGIADDALREAATARMEAGAPASGRTLAALCEAGLADIALGSAAPASVLEAPAPLVRLAGERGRAAVEAAARAVSLPAAAPALAVLGDWDAALHVLGPSGSTSAEQIVALAGLLDGTVADGTIERLASAGAALDGPDRARLEAAIARRLAELGDDRAETWLRRGIRGSLAELAEGDADRLRHCVALALLADGDDAAAALVAERATWEHSRVEALAALIGAGLERGGAPVAAWAERLRVLVFEFADDTFAGEALEAATRAIHALTEPCPAAADALCRAAESLLGRGLQHGPGGAVALADAWWPRDALESVRLLELARARAQSADQAAELFAALGRLQRVPADQATWCVRHAPAVEPDDALERLKVDAARAAALARLGDPAGAAALPELVERLPAIAASGEQDSAGILTFKRLLADLTGASFQREADAAGAVAAAVSASAGEPGAEDAARALLAWAGDVAPDVREPTLKACLTPLCASQAARPWLSDWIPDALPRWVPDATARVLLAGAAGALADAGDLDAADAVAARIQDQDLTERLASRREWAAAGPATPLARALLEDDDSGIAGLVLYLVEQEGPQTTLRELLAWMCHDDFQEPRSRVLGAFAPLTVPALLGIGGAPALHATLAAVEQADARLVGAARLIAT